MSEIIEKQTNKQALKPPVMWNVLFFNDDYTTVEFVVSCLKFIFNKSEEQGHMIAMEIHSKGKGVVGQYSKDIAITKQVMAQKFAKDLGHPLMVEIEPAA